jgi:hypothetical protein
METSTNSYSGTDSRSFSFASLLRRAPLIMMTVVFTLISFRNLVQPVHSAAKAGIIFTSQSGITIARIGFGAFPLSLAILAFASLVSARWRLAGLYMVLTVDSVVILVRLLGFWLDHSTTTVGLLVPEFVLLALAIIAIRLESAVPPTKLQA